MRRRNLRSGMFQAAWIGVATLVVALVVPSASADVAVLTSLAVTPTSPSVPIGGTIQLTATGTYSDGTTADLTSVALWTSSALAVSVSPTGLATAASAGSATVQAQVDAITDSTTVTVPAPTLTALAVTPTSPSVPIGGTIQLTATGTYSDGTTADLTSVALWTSSVASTTVSNAAGSTGLARAVNFGSATVTATIGGLNASTVVTVTARVYTPGAITHVIWIMMENHSASTVIGQPQAPYINALVKGAGLATTYFGIAHPSLPNYLGAVSGQPLASLPLTDCTSCKQSVASLFTQGETWKAYQESMPTPCKAFMSTDGLYVPRHNPGLYFTQISAASCAASDVPYPVLATDLAKNTLPAFSFVTPNLAHDMHNGTTTTQVAAGDAWLATSVPAILNSPGYLAGTTALFITWDEGNGVGNIKGTDCTKAPTNVSCRVALVVASQYTTPGTVASATYTHYSLLRATEGILGLPLLGQAAVVADLAPAFGL